MLNSQLQSGPAPQDAAPTAKSFSADSATAHSRTQSKPAAKSRASGSRRSVTVPASPVGQKPVQEAPELIADMPLSLEQLQAEVSRCHAELKASEREGSLRAGLIQKLCEDLREPISNINMAVRMLTQASSDSERIRYSSILRTECARQLEILNNVNRMQIVMGAYGAPRSH